MTELRKGSDSVQMRRVEFVGPQVGGELIENGALALLFVSLGIVAYLALRFEWKFGVAAIIANLHDVVIILGFFSLFQWDFSLTVLAAILAILGYSVNESVVVFDRIRENFRKMRKASVTTIIDNAITRTTSRTIITHGCTQLMVTSMLFFGGESLHYFALALTIGICFGIYSSVLVASPIVMWLRVSREDLVKPEKKTEIGQQSRPRGITRAVHRHRPAPRPAPDVAGRQLRGLGLPDPVPDHFLRDRFGGDAVFAGRLAAVRRRHAGGRGCHGSAWRVCAAGIGRVQRRQHQLLDRALHRPRVFRLERSRLFNPAHLKRTHRFYEKHGGKTVIFARFLPIVRTFAPFVAGIGRMTYPKFLFYSFSGSVFWIGFSCSAATISATFRWSNRT